MMFGQPQQAQSPAMFGGGQIDPQMLQRIMMMMHQGVGQPPQPAGMPPGGMNPVNVPQQGLMPSQSPLAGAGPSQQMNPLASILGNQGGAVSPQGQMQNGSAMGGDGGGGLMQIINAMKSQNQVNGSQPEQAGPGGMDIMAIIKAIQGG